MTQEALARGHRPPGRPRSEKAEKAIIDATLDLLGEGVSISELSIEAIAARAGVGKTTIYRRWSGKEDLVVEAMASLKSPFPEPAGISVREDLIAIVEIFQAEHTQTRTRCLMNMAFGDAERHPELARRFRQVSIEPRRAVLRGILQRGVATGELRPDLDVEIAMAMLTGTILIQARWAQEQEPVPADLHLRVVDAVLAGLTPR